MPPFFQEITHSFPIHCTHTCCHQLILNPLEHQKKLLFTPEEDIEAHSSSGPNTAWLTGQAQAGTGFHVCPLKSLSDLALLPLSPFSYLPACPLRANEEQRGCFPALGCCSPSPQTAKLTSVCGAPPVCQTSHSCQDDLQKALSAGKLGARSGPRAG